MRAAAAFYGANHNYLIWKDGDMNMLSAPAIVAELVSVIVLYTAGVNIATVDRGYNILEDGDFKNLCIMLGAGC